MNYMDLTLNQRSIILHTCGLSNSKNIYRNFYNTQKTDEQLLSLVKIGIMEGPFNGMYPIDYGDFRLTELGLDIARRIK